MSTNSSSNLYIAKNKAIKYLDLTAAEFRRVCINNNIFPRVPGNKFDGETAYYLKADVKALKRSTYVEHLFD